MKRFGLKEMEAETMNKIMVSRLDLLEMAKKFEGAETARTAVMRDVLNLVPRPKEKVNADTKGRICSQFLRKF